MRRGRWPCPPQGAPSSDALQRPGTSNASGGKRVLQKAEFMSSASLAALPQGTAGGMDAPGHASRVRVAVRLRPFLSQELAAEEGGGTPTSAVEARPRRQRCAAQAGRGRGLPGWASRGRAFAAAAARGGRRRLRQSFRPCGCRLLRRSPKSFCGAANGTQRHPPCASLVQPSFPRCSTQLPAAQPLLEPVVFLVHCRLTNLTPCLQSTPRRPAALSPESWTLGLFYCPLCLLLQPTSSRGSPCCRRSVSMKSLLARL